jgi:hypothetical protein
LRRAHIPNTNQPVSGKGEAGLYERGIFPFDCFDGLP